MMIYKAKIWSKLSKNKNANGGTKSLRALPPVVDPGRPNIRIGRGSIDTDSIVYGSQTLGRITHRTKPQNSRACDAIEYDTVGGNYGQDYRDISNRTR